MTIDRKAFIKWAVAHGAIQEIEDNEWLVCRLRTKYGILKAYRNKKGEENWIQMNPLDEVYLQRPDTDITPLRKRKRKVWKLVPIAENTAAGMD